MRIKHMLIGLVGVFALASFNASLSRSVYAQEAAPSSAFIAEVRAKAEVGDAEAQEELGNMYYWGRGVPEDNAQARRWYRKAVASYRKAAEAGDAPAQFNLGNMYYSGRGVPQNYATAVSWYRKAAQQGNAKAQTALGWMYDKGEGVPKNYATAMSWYRKAAQQGNAEAQFKLGYMYAFRGVPKNLVNAYMWANLAAAQGDYNANDLKAQISPGMTSVQISQTQRLSRECLAKNYQECGL